MEQWERAGVDLLCGYCGNHICQDAPIHVTTLANIKRKRIRGQCCAGPAPPDLPARIERTRIEATHFEPLAKMIPKRTRGELKTMARKEWMPFRDSQEREP